MAVKEWISRRVFSTVHSNNLVYNTCWEDPRLDRVAMELSPDDNVVVLTSAGCNALDYALAGPRHVYAVDMNPRQNALLELKQAAIRELPFADFFRMFGEGYLPGVRQFYDPRLRRHLSPESSAFWDKRIVWFDNARRSFYFRGTSGSFARYMKFYTDRVIKVRPQLEQLLAAQSIEEQQAVYFNGLYDKFWSRGVKFTMNRDTTLSMLGIPKAQRRQIETQYPGGLIRYMQDCVESVFARLPFKDNYFWRVYINGCYSRECCPEYLREENFDRLRDGLVDKVSTHTNSVQAFLEEFDGQINRFVLLDHMDWMSDRYFDSLIGEWQAIVDRSAAQSRLLWRSGGMRTDFIDQVQVRRNGQATKVNEMLTYNTDLAAELHALDRVHTYGSFYIADLAV